MAHGILIEMNFAIHLTCLYMNLKMAEKKLIQLGNQTGEYTVIKHFLLILPR